MKRAEALQQIAELQQAWSLKWGDTIEAPAEMNGEDVSVWSAEMGATAEQQDALNAQIMEILAQVVDDGAPVDRISAHGLPLNLTAAEVDLSKVQRDWERQLDALLGQWFTVTAKQRDQILDKVRAAVNNNDLAALAAFNVSSAEQAQILTESMTQMALQAAQRVTDEAAKQGVRIDPVATDTHRFAASAVALAALLTAGLTNAAGREALRRWSPTTTGDEVAAAVRTQLEGLSTSFVEDHLGGALHAASNAGRMETQLSGPVAAIYASEMMDKRTCPPCEKVNGKWIGNSDDPNIVAKVEAVYPNGGYRDCEGGVRCRGTTVSIYRPEQVGPAGA